MRSWALSSSCWRGGEKGEGGMKEDGDGKKRR